MLDRVPWLACLPPEELARLQERLTSRRFEAEEQLFLEGEPGRELFLIEDGSVRVCRESSQGREVTLAIRRAGEFVGDMALLDGGPRSASAYANGGPCRCQVLLGADLVSALRKNPEATLSLCTFLSLRLREASDRMEDLALRTVRQRLAGALARAAARDGEPAADGTILLPAWISYQHLIGLLGTIRESVSRATKELVGEGLIARQGRQFAVLNVEGLWQVALESD